MQFKFYFQIIPKVNIFAKELFVLFGEI